LANQDRRGRRRTSIWWEPPFGGSGVRIASTAWPASRIVGCAASIGTLRPIYAADCRNLGEYTPVSEGRLTKIGGGEDECPFGGSGVRMVRTAWSVFRIVEGRGFERGDRLVQQRGGWSAIGALRPICAPNCRNLGEYTSVSGGRLAKIGSGRRKPRPSPAIFGGRCGRAAPGSAVLLAHIAMSAYIWWQWTETPAT
jgi:hypothetical protein